MKYFEQQEENRINYPNIQNKSLLKLQRYHMTLFCFENVKKNIWKRLKSTVERQLDVAQSRLRQGRSVQDHIILIKQIIA